MWKSPPPYEYHSLSCKSGNSAWIESELYRSDALLGLLHNQRLLITTHQSLGLLAGGEAPRSEVQTPTRQFPKKGQQSESLLPLSAAVFSGVSTVKSQKSTGLPSADSATKRSRVIEVDLISHVVRGYQRAGP